MATVTINGHTYTDDANPTTGLGGGGHRARFIPLVSDVVTVAGAIGATGSLTANRALVTNASGKVAASTTITDTELGYLDGVTSAIQTQINAKAPIASPTFTETVIVAGAGNPGLEIGRTDGVTSTPFIDFHSGATATGYDSRIIASGGNGTVREGTLSFEGNIVLPATTNIGAISSTELGYLDGVTSAIQTQINAKAPIVSPTFTETVSGITKAMVGLGNVDNTSDANKPVSTAQQTALNLKAGLDNPTFTGPVIVTGAGNASLEIGRTDGVTSTPFIDFHSGATATGYDSRILASGGNGTSEGGDLAFFAANVVSYATLYVQETKEQLRLEYDTTRYLSFTVDSAGDAILKSSSNKIRLSDTARTPASATADGKAGEVCWDSNYVYVCVATNTWKRSALSTW